MSIQRVQVCSLVDLVHTLLQLWYLVRVLQYLLLTIPFLHPLSHQSSSLGPHAVITTYMQNVNNFSMVILQANIRELQGIYLKAVPVSFVENHCSWPLADKLQSPSHDLPALLVWSLHPCECSLINPHLIHCIHDTLL